MRLYTVQNSWCNYRVISIPVDEIMPSRPVPNWPHGRKALHMALAWERARALGHPGVLWLDPDVAADPDDLSAMDYAVARAPDLMWTAAVKLWPESTGLPYWIWSHRGGTLGQPVATQDESVSVAYVATGFLWTPGALLDLAFPRYSHWQWEQVDVGLSELALAAGISARLVPGCRPKHVHFTPDHDGRAIAERE